MQSKHETYYKSWQILKFLINFSQACNFKNHSKCKHLNFSQLIKAITLTLNFSSVLNTK
jgi:hypothetical protein